MSGIPLLNPYENAPGRTRSASASQHIDDQIDALRRQAAAAVGRGSLSADRGVEIAGRLTEIQQTVDAGTADGSMTRDALREIARTLQEIRMAIAQANRARVEATERIAADDRSGGPAPSRALDLTV